MKTAKDVSEAPRSFVERFADGVCRRSFSSPEAVAYELTIARALSRVVQPVVEPHLGALTLDVGCGGGSLAHSLADAHPSQIVGIDPSASQAKRFRRSGLRRESRTVVVRSGAEHLPFADRTFDAVYSSCAWKHWPDPNVGMSECVRVARSGAALVIVEIDGDSSREDFRRFAGRSRVPLGLRRAYVRFAMRTVVGVAPNAGRLLQSFDGLHVSEPAVARIGTLPFNVATATVR